MKGLRACRVTAVDDVGEGEIWDFTVPVFANYELGGVIHHNSGKTTMGSLAIATKALGFDPILRESITYPEDELPANFYCVGPTLGHVKRIMHPAMRRWIPESEIIHIDNKYNIWTLSNKNRLHWKAFEQGADAFQGDEVNAAWVDEEPRDKYCWDELLSRVFRRMGTIYMTLTPWHGTTWLHHWLFSPDEVPLEKKHVERLPVYQNPYYQDAPEKLEHYLGNWRRGSMTYKIRIEGHFLLMAGKPVFDQTVLDRLIATCKEPLVGFLNDSYKFVHIRDWENDPRAWLRCLAAPRQGGRYIIGVDVGGGNPLGDYHAAMVVDCDTGEQVALGHTRDCEPRHFGTLLAQLAKCYQNAFIVPEVNNHGISVTDRLRELGYGNIYSRQVIDKKDLAPVNKIGFMTTQSTKAKFVDLLSDMVGRGELKLRDPIIQAEMFNYTWLKALRDGTFGVGNSNPEGHDDTMTAAGLVAIGMQALGYTRSKIADPKPTVARVSVEETFWQDARPTVDSEEDVVSYVSDLDEFDEP